MCLPMTIKLWRIWSVSGLVAASYSLLTTTSVIPVMPVCMVMIPNPGGRNRWPKHCNRGVHYVRPFDFGPWLAIVMAFEIAPDIPREKKKPAEQHY